MLDYSKVGSSPREFIAYRRRNAISARSSNGGFWPRKVENTFIFLSLSAILAKVKQDGRVMSQSASDPATDQRVLPVLSSRAGSAVEQALQMMSLRLSRASSS